MVVVLTDGTELTLDRVVRQGLHQAQPQRRPNLLLFKHAIKFIFKEEERDGRRRRRTPPPPGLGACGA